MNDVERVLRSDVAGLVDRLTATVPASGVAPAVQSRAVDAEERLATAYRTLVEDYGRWRVALDDLENIWALAVWRAAFAEEPVEGFAAAPAAPTVRRAA